MRDPEIADIFSKCRRDIHRACPLIAPEEWYRYGLGPFRPGPIALRMMYSLPSLNYAQTARIARDLAN